MSLSDRLPGDLTREEKLKRMIRVDHAGEYGAVRIYAGQLAVLKNSSNSNTIKHMEEQEQKHLAKFNELIVENKVRPSALLPLWYIAGFALGAATALIGEKAAMACTVAVEEVIDEHYQKQEKELGVEEPELKSVIVKFRKEELEHRDIGIKHDAENAPVYPLLKGVIKTISRYAIWLSERI